MSNCESEKKRCRWCNLKNPLYVAYHDDEWGVFPDNEQKLYELFILETFHSGLSWECILNKRENFRRSYDNFDIERVMEYAEEKINRLMADSSIVRNRKKIEASIKNSRIYYSIEKTYGSFKAYLMSFSCGEVIIEPDSAVTTSVLSDMISRDLKARGMSYVGSITIYSFLQAVGIINGHEKDCFCYIGHREKI